MKAVIIDFFILVSLAAVILGGIYLARLILYPGFDSPQLIRLEVGPIDKIYSASLEKGDLIYDTVTKRRIGYITDIERREVGEEVYVTLTAYAERKPRASALRTPKLWFEYREAANTPYSES